MPVQTHQINVHGLSGGIFWTTLLAVVFFVVGYATTGWQHYSGGNWIGLWSVCSSSSNHPYNSYDWFKATQAMTTLGLIFLILALMFIFLYMFVHSVSVSKSLLLKMFTFFSFMAVLSIVIGLSVFGTKTDNRYLHWSYAFAAIGAIFAVVAAILSLVQMKKASII